MLPRTTGKESDAELIARAYARWDTECLHHLEGDFAFALWDTRRQRLFCARDPLGVRSFYYRWQKGRFVWAPRLQPLLEDPDYAPAPDEASLAEYLLGWSHFPDASATFYRGIRQLAAGHFLTVQHGRLEVRRYWDVDPNDERLYQRSFLENTEEFRELFRRAMRRRLPREGRAGILVSGGVDSTSIACVAVEAGRTNGLPGPFLLNYHFPAPFGDERDYVRAFEQRHQCPVETLAAAESFQLFDGLNRVARESETPLLDPLWSLTRRWVDRMRAQDIHILLSGFGGDNIFPDAYSSCLDAFRRAGWGAGRRALQACATSWQASPALLWGRVLRAWLPARLKIAAKRLARREISPWLRPDFARRSGLLERIRQPLPQRGFSSPSREMTYRQLTSGRLSAQLTFYDQLGAAHELELRYPFFDPALVRFVLLAPWDQQTTDGTIKRLLREAMRGSLPEAVRLRQEKGTPDFFLVRWIREKELARWERLVKPKLLVASYVRTEYLQRLIESVKQGNTAAVKPLWSLLSLEFWLRNHFGNST